MEWFTRHGAKFEGKVHDVNEAKGTAAHTYQSKCSRCGGAGGSQKWAYTGYTCFECGGSGAGPIRTEKLYSAERLSKLDASQAKRDAKRAEKAAAAKLVRDAEIAAVRTAFYAENRELIDALTAYITRVGNSEEAANPFLLEMDRKLTDYGTLSPKQAEATLAALERSKALFAAREASNFVGEIGQRVELTVTVERVITLERGDWGTPRVCLSRDENGNRVVYIGTGSFPNAGETARVKATVAAHDIYRDEKQTKLARPKVIAAAAA